MKDSPFWTKFTAVPCCCWLLAAPPTAAFLVFNKNINHWTCDHVVIMWFGWNTTKALFQWKGDSTKEIQGPNCHRNWSPSWNSLSWGVSIFYVHEGVFVVTINNSLGTKCFWCWDLTRGALRSFSPNKGFKGVELVLLDHCGCLKSPRVGSNDSWWCILSMWNVLGLFGASQGIIWGPRQFHPVEPGILALLRW